MGSEMCIRDRTRLAWCCGASSVVDALGEAQPLRTPLGCTAAISSTILVGSWCAQNRRTAHPCCCRWRETSASLRTFAARLSDQNSALDLGAV